MSKWLSFEEDDHYEGKTKLLYVKSKTKLEILAVIKWYSPWRQYCFYPMPETIWNKECMDDVQTVIKDLMAERAHQHAERQAERWPDNVSP